MPAFPKDAITIFARADLLAAIALGNAMSGQGLGRGRKLQLPSQTTAAYTLPTAWSPTSWTSELATIQSGYESWYKVVDFDTTTNAILDYDSSNINIFRYSSPEYFVPVDGTAGLFWDTDTLRASDTAPSKPYVVLLYFTDSSDKPQISWSQHPPQ